MYKFFKFILKNVCYGFDDEIYTTQRIKQKIDFQFVDLMEILD